MPTQTLPNAQRVARFYRDFLADPGSVDAGWRDLFEQLDEEAGAWLAGLDAGTPPRAEQAAPAATPLGDDAQRAALDSVRALMLIRAYRVRGHLQADLDPLGVALKEPHPELDPASYGFEEADLDRPIYVHGVLGFNMATMREIVSVLRRDYCGKMGLEFMHLQDPDQKSWIQQQMEGVIHRTSLKTETKLEILDRLTAAETFEKFLDRKYTGTKRFGLDGSESMLAAMETIVQEAADLGVSEIVLGMAHRGRLNVLANVMHKPLQAIFHEFHGGSATEDDFGGSGDVKYHLGTSTDREIGGHSIHLSLVSNPSHLEAVDPVVLGKVRSSQEQWNDAKRALVMGVLVHGDAAFAGQGVVAETLQFTDLEGYTTGGVIHLIINNQIGFTTSPTAARSSPYPSDLAKGIQAPIIHVNGDDPEAVVLAATYAVQYRQLFKRDVVIDLWCYRRYGHNEADEPSFTQPLMYERIRAQAPVRELYGRRLVAEGTTTEEEVDKLKARYEKLLADEFEASHSYRPAPADWLKGAWSGLEPMSKQEWEFEPTGVEITTLQEIGKGLIHVPEHFTVHRRLTRLLRNKQQMFESGEGFDWATGEALAFGSLLLEGFPVRLAGEDSNRGTFSHRHASWIDQTTAERFVPLNHIRVPQSSIEIVDSPLSEFGALGFEYGYAVDEPFALIVWEAQFGDFVNGAQVIIDQFITPGEAKWLRMCGLVMLLPHGYEGQGPEHSSARLERFLQLCAEDNMQVVNCTTPASYFHVLRRQLHRNYRKPLIVMAPKSLLRHPRAVSRIEEFGPGTLFKMVLHDENEAPEKIRQLVLCTGKVYYDLLEEKEKREQEDVRLIRLEQIYPFPDIKLGDAIRDFNHCRIVWCQEEPENMGAWRFVRDRIRKVADENGFEDPTVHCAARPASASPATGLFDRHVAQQARLVNEALTVPDEVKAKGKASKAAAKRKSAPKKRAAPKSAAGRK